ncbi:MAG: hypothetical protein ACOCX2_02790 [Armatimonadota bacterium]
MKRTGIAAVTVGITLALVATGCGGGGDGGGNAVPNNSYLPMQVGNSWDYVLTLAPGLVPVQEGSNQLFDYHETITGIANLDGADYFLFRSVRDETDQYPERVWQQIRRETDEAIYARVGNPAYDLPVLMLPPRQGETWPDPFFEEVTLTTAAVGEQVTVPAGTFNCVRVEQTYEVPLEGGDVVVETTKQWFARGVGLVKDETWDDDILTTRTELTDYTVQ